MCIFERNIGKKDKEEEEEEGKEKKEEEKEEEEEGEGEGEGKAVGRHREAMSILCQSIYEFSQESIVSLFFFWIHINKLFI